MYFLLLFLHILFFSVSYYNGYNLLAGIFLFLGMLFVFYFSPVFSYLLKKDGESRNASVMSHFTLSGFSNESLFIISLFLLYFSIYGIVLGTIPWNNLAVIAGYHYTVVLGVYVFLMGVYFIFQGKVGAIWFRVVRIHTLFSFILGILFMGWVFFGYAYSPLLFFIGSLFPIIMTIWFLAQEKISTDYIEMELFLSFLVTLVVIIPTFTYFYLEIHAPIFLIFEVVMSALLLFEWLPSIDLFRWYEKYSQYTGLIVSYGAIFLLFFLSFSELLFSILLLVILIFFHVSVHMRYENYLSFGVAILSLFFVYSSLFYGMILPEVGFFSALMFLFFLPFLLIGLSYFWEQEYEYDFIFIHYASIGFSIFGSIYYLISLGYFSLVHLSIIALLLSALFFLSYMRLGDTGKII